MSLLRTTISSLSPINLLTMGTHPLFSTLDHVFPTKTRVYSYTCRVVKCNSLPSHTSMSLFVQPLTSPNLSTLIKTNNEVKKSCYKILKLPENPLKSDNLSLNFCLGILYQLQNKKKKVEPSHKTTYTH